MTETAVESATTVSSEGSDGDARVKAKAATAASAAQDQAGQLASTAKDQAGEVLSTAKDQAANVIGDAAGQARSLLRDAQTELTAQADVQKGRAVTGLRSLSQDLSTMAENSERPGTAHHVVAEVARRSGAFAEFLDVRDPGHLVDEVRNLGRRRTGAFLLGAAVLGFAGGRLLKGSRADADTPAPSDAVPTPNASTIETPASPHDEYVPPSAVAMHGSLARTPHLLPDDDV